MTDSIAAAEWVRCRHYIEAALANSPGFETIDDVERMLCTGNYMLWTGRECAAIVEISQYAAKRVIAIVHGGGDKNELADELEPMIEAFGRERGCDLIGVMGRKGWIREGEKRGWHLGYVCMLKALKH